MCSAHSTNPKHPVILTLTLFPSVFPIPLPENREGEKELDLSRWVNNTSAKLQGTPTIFSRAFMAIKFQVPYKLPRPEENAIPMSSIKAVRIPAL